MWDGFNQRKFPRINLKCEIVIFPVSDHPPIKATTENVGVGGVCVIQDKKLDRFTRCKIKLELSDTVEALECDGKVCWIIPKSNPIGKTKGYDTGIEFVGLSADQRVRLEEFLQKNYPSAKS